MDTTTEGAAPNPVRLPDRGYPAYATTQVWCGMSGMSRSATYEVLGEALGLGDLRAIQLGARTLVDVGMA